MTFGRVLQVNFSIFLGQPRYNNFTFEIIFNEIQNLLAKSIGNIRVKKLLHKSCQHFWSRVKDRLRFNASLDALLIKFCIYGSIFHSSINAKSISIQRVIIRRKAPTIFKTLLEILDIVSLFFFQTNNLYKL